MLNISHPNVSREQGWAAFRQTRDVRLRERSHRSLLLLDGKTCSEMAQRLYRDEETIRSWVHAVNDAGLPGLAREEIPGQPA